MFTDAPPTKNRQNMWMTLTMVSRHANQQIAWKFKPKRIRFHITKTKIMFGINGICDAKPSNWPTFNGVARIQRRRRCHTIEILSVHKHTANSTIRIKQTEMEKPRKADTIEKNEFRFLICIFGTFISLRKIKCLKIE